MARAEDHTALARTTMRVEITIGAHSLLLTEEQARHVAQDLTRLFHLGDVALDRLDATETLAIEALDAASGVDALVTEIEERYTVMSEHMQRIDERLDLQGAPPLDRSSIADELIGPASPPVPPQEDESAPGMAPAAPAQPEPAWEEMPIAPASVNGRHGEPYSDDEDARIRQLLLAGKSYAAIGTALGRTRQGVQAHITGTYDLYALVDGSRAAAEQVNDTVRANVAQRLSEAEKDGVLGQVMDGGGSLTQAALAVGDTLDGARVRWKRLLSEQRAREGAH